MPQMNSLPYELLEAVVDEVCDLEDLKTMRVLNRTFCALGSSPYAVVLETPIRARPRVILHPLRERVRRTYSPSLTA